MPKPWLLSDAPAQGVTALRATSVTDSPADSSRGEDGHKSCEQQKAR